MAAILQLETHDEPVCRARVGARELRWGMPMQVPSLTLDDEQLWHRLLDGHLRVAASGWLNDARILTLSERCPAVPLTPMERAVLTFVVLGASNKRVALELGVAPSTVSCHLRQARRKLGATEAELLLLGPLLHRLPQLRRAS